MSEAEFLQVIDLHKDFGGTHALRGVSLTLARGAWCAVVGPSGSGKTTLLNLIGGLDDPTSGSVSIDGVQVNGLAEAELARLRREKIGFVFQRAELLPYLDCVENVMLAQYFHSTTDEQEAQAALEQVGLSHRLHHRPAQLSAGEQQRVSIVRALINEPGLLLADEPTGNLDQQATGQVLEVLKTLHRRKAFSLVLVTHDAQVASWADRVVTLVDGRVDSDVTTSASSRDSPSML